MAKTKQQKYWFKHKSHVWQPTSWQGWLTVVLFIAVVVGNALVVAFNPYSNELLWLYLNILIMSVVTVLIVAYVKGPESS